MKSKAPELSGRRDEGQGRCLGAQVMASAPRGILCRSAPSARHGDGPGWAGERQALFCGQRRGCQRHQCSMFSLARWHRLVLCALLPAKRIAVFLDTKPPACSSGQRCPLPSLSKQKMSPFLGGGAGDAQANVGNRGAAGQDPNTNSKTSYVKQIFVS